MEKIIDAAHGGEGWQGREYDHLNDIGKLWSDCGVSAESDPLKRVLLRRPGKEIERLEDPQNLLWLEKLNPEKARYQHDTLVDVYRQWGVNVELLEDHAADLYPNLMYVRDSFTMTPQGAIVSRLASKIRSGEETIVSKQLSNMGVPIVATAHANMLLEGPDIFIVNKNLVFLGVGIRTNYEAVHFVRYLLELQGFAEIHIIQTTYGCGHLDGVVSILNSSNAVIIPQRASYQLYEVLKRHGFHIIELSNLKEIDENMAINFVALNEENIVINKGAADSVKKYEAAGVNCMEVDLSEITKGGGAVHCITGVIKRG
ncbi:dimethylarginine dimethylaminohydrolase family protein [Mesobacillus zeae]